MESRNDEIAHRRIGILYLVANSNLNQGTAAVRVRHLVKRYKNGTEATGGIDFTAQRGEAIAILGANGAGKTTFLRQLTTELRPTGGTVEIFGIDAVRFPQRAKVLMGITPQEAGIFETLTVREHLALFGRLKGLSKIAAHRQTDEILTALELEKEAQKRVGTLSGGQKRRVLIGLALLGKPPLLILDEPTTGLDPLSRRAVWNLLQSVIASGTTVILSTHYMEEAEHLSRRIAFINAGKIIADGTLNELRARFPNKYRVTYHSAELLFGTPQVEFFASFDDAQAHLAAFQIAEYQIATTTLEDVYFSLVGERLTTAETKTAQ